MDTTKLALVLTTIQTVKTQLEQLVIANETYLPEQHERLVHFFLEPKNLKFLVAFLEYGADFVEEIIREEIGVDVQ